MQCIHHDKHKWNQPNGVQSPEEFHAYRSCRQVEIKIYYHSPNNGEKSVKNNKSRFIADANYIRVAQNQLTEFARFTKSNAT